MEDGPSYARPSYERPQYERRLSLVMDGRRYWSLNVLGFLITKSSPRDPSRTGCVVTNLTLCQPLWSTGPNEVTSMVVREVISEPSEFLHNQSGY